jgi:nucleoid-associated protein YgaU
MAKERVMMAGLMVVSLGLSGCLVRSYELTQPRVDQNLESGNRGFLMGSAPDVGERKMTRTTQVVEFEIGKPMRFERRSRMTQEAPAEQESVVLDTQESYVQEEAPLDVSMQRAPSYQSYVVQKGDTLQKISNKFFGTTKKWHKIYEANKGELRGPDKIYPGQTIRIPDVESVAPVKPLKMK